MFESISDDAELKMASFSEPKDAADNATIKLNFAVGETIVKPLIASDNLFEADLSYIGELDFEVTGDTEKNIVLKQKSENPVKRTVKQAFGSFSHGRDLRWDIRLSPDLPIDLQINGGVGRSELDLSELKLTQLRMNTGAGKHDIMLPTSTEGYNVTIKGGVGETVIDLPVDTTVDLKVDAGVGAVRLNLPANVALRVKAKGGVGDVNVPEHMERLSGGREFVSINGVWQTPNFDEATNKITVNYNGGIGELKVASDVTVV